MANRNDGVWIAEGKTMTFLTPAWMRIHMGNEALSDMQKAYTRLRDAAPELLIALKIARTRLAWFVEYRGGDEGDQAALHQIDAAIMKAEDEATD